MKDKSTIMSAGILLMLLVLLGKFAAFARDVVISAFYGATSLTDAYFVASNVPALIFAAFYSTISLVFLPFYNEKRLLEGADSADMFASNVLNVYVLVSFILSVIGIYFAPSLIGIMAPSFNVATATLAVELTKIFCLSFVFTSITGILSSIQYANKQYYGPHIVPLFNNIVVVICITLLAKQYGIYVAAISAVLGWVCQVPMQKLFLGKKFKYKIHLNLKDVHLQKMTWLFFPAFIGVSVDQLNILIDTILGSGLIEGSISALNYSNRLMNFASGMFVILVTTIMYPKFSDYVIEKKITSLSIAVTKSIRSLILITAPIMSIVFIFYYEIVSIVFGRGAFDESDVILTSNVFVCYSIGIVFIVVRETLNRVFYSLKDTKSPLIISIIAVTINIILSLILVKYMQAQGLALATAISTIIYCILQFIRLGKTLGKEFCHNYSAFIVKVIISCCLMLYVMYTFRNEVSYDYLFINLTVGSIFGVIFYLILLYVLRVPEIILVSKKGWAFIGKLKK